MGRKCCNSNSIVEYPYQTNNEDKFVKSINFVDRFIMTLDCKHVNAKEIKVKVIGENMRIEFIKEDKSSGCRCVKSHCKIYKLPDNVDSRSIKYSFNDNGDLIITGEKE
uniref:SHSP domain-containing protein n=1 Tax=Parastrongyloides trichosuri TaxID=131310 RepID=A0A0N4Z274_PARTI